MKAYVINLDKRPDRLARISAHLEELGIPMERIAAYDGTTLDFIVSNWRKRGRSTESKWRGEFGCYMSHMLALSEAMHQKIFPCMILEDDCILSEVPQPEPGMVYLGGFESSKGLFGLHAVMYNTWDDAADFSYHADDQQKAIDAIANDYRMKHPDRVRKYSKGFIATQAKDFSDIEGAIVSRTPGGSVKIHTE